MSDGQSKILASLEFTDDSEKLKEDLSKCLDGESKLISGATAELMGTGADTIILILGTSGAIAAVSRTIIAWITANKARTVKINGSQFNGYSAEDVAKMLSATPQLNQSQSKAKEEKNP
ncbi:hypothetical protein [Methylobacterium sp. Leaf456]|uniref:effector-associated constant component EACC1 n=1 Tax=Methylobacterium sp. Leaf456 TaxID=1736382 RepID=UPI0012E33F1E|nr:hypothetical protein [Methylobacterium sp. Leaf456]